MVKEDATEKLPDAIEAGSRSDENIFRLLTDNYR